MLPQAVSVGEAEDVEEVAVVEVKLDELTVEELEAELEIVLDVALAGLEIVLGVALDELESELETTLDTELDELDELEELEELVDELPAATIVTAEFPSVNVGPISKASPSS